MKRWYVLTLDECVVECETAGGWLRLHRPGCRYVASTVGRKWFVEDGTEYASTDPSFFARAVCGSCVTGRAPLRARRDVRWE